MIYFDILRFNFLQFVHYPVEILVSTLSKILSVIFLVLFWSLVLKETGNEEQLYSLLGYFLIAEGLSSITMSSRMKYGSYLRKQIKSGGISKSLLYPFRILPGTYFEVLGGRSIQLIPSIIMMLVGIWIYQPSSPISLVLFVYFLLVASAIGFSMNLFEGILTFYVTQPSGLISAMGHFVRLFSGALIPLNYFPAALATILSFLPPTMLIFTPITMLDVSTIDRTVILTCLLGLFWALFLNILTYHFWRKGLRKYEAIGL